MYIYIYVYLTFYRETPEISFFHYNSKETYVITEDFGDDVSFF